MPTEIERKFRVTGHNWRQPDAIRIRQGYLNRDKNRTVRVRTYGDRAYLTVKGITRESARAEFEYEIPLADAEQLLTLRDGPTIEKDRHRVEYEGHTWEVDEFFGDNAGLIVAEIELDSKEQSFARPDWLGEEVTNDPRYFNSYLTNTPYSMWT